MTAIERLVARAMRPTAADSLGAWRIGFGAIMALSFARFFYYGWIDQLYAAPAMRFTYWGLRWLPGPPQGLALHALFAAMLLLSVAIALGLRTRALMPLFVAGFVWIESFDKSTYLNHYYFITIIALLMCLMPMDAALSWRSRGRGHAASAPAWCVWALRAMLAIVYLHAGVAKLNPDWLMHGQPLTIWLGARAHWPLVGTLLAQRPTALVMSWAGALFDLTIWALLLWPRSRPLAYLTALGFHLVTWALFPIGVFPWVMMGATTLFFARDWPRRLLGTRGPSEPMMQGQSKLSAALAAAMLLLQLALPWRCMLYPGDVQWHEQGYRFSWRVMLTEKRGDVSFEVVSPRTGQRWRVLPSETLTRLQEDMMSTQPDMILEYAHHLAEAARARGVEDAQVFARAYVSYNGRPSAALIDPHVDLATQRDTLAPWPWILPAPTR